MENYVGTTIDSGYKLDVNGTGRNSEIKNYVVECKGNDGGGCFLDSCGHDCGCFTVEQTPEIPQLGEGVEMEVSDNGVEWLKRKVVAQMHNGSFMTLVAQMHTGSFMTYFGVFYQYARPIQEVKKYTKEELVKIVGHDFEMV